MYRKRYCTHNCLLFCVQTIQLLKLFKLQYLFLYIFLPYFIIKVHYEVWNGCNSCMIYNENSNACCVSIYSNSIPSYHHHSSITSISAGKKLTRLLLKCQLTAMPQAVRCLSLVLSEFFLKFGSWQQFVATALNFNEYDVGTLMVWWNWI